MNMIEETRSDINQSYKPVIATAEFQRLDPRTIPLWRLSNLLGWSIVIILLIVTTIALMLRFDLPAIAVISAWSLLLALIVWLTWFRPPRLYNSWRYRIDDRVLETRSGLLVEVSRLLPLNRLQHVDLHRGPLERMFGLASLVLHTAGTHSASITIPGLDSDTASRLRDHLIEIGGDDAV